MRSAPTQARPHSALGEVQSLRGVCSRVPQPAWTGTRTMGHHRGHMGAPRDDIHLLSIFHWVLAGLAALFSALPLLYVAMGVAMLQGKFDGRNQPPPFFGWMMVVMGIALMLLGLGYAALVAYAGRCVGRTRHWTFVIVVAALSCAFFPFGTVLGAFTIIVLSKPEVKSLFQPQAASAGAPAVSPLQ